MRKKMSKRLKTLRKLPTQLEVIKTLRRQMPPRGKVILTKKDKPFRKQKHKKQLDFE